MEFKDLPMNGNLTRRFEIVLEHRLEREVIVAALSNLAISAMTGSSVTMNRESANKIIRYLTLDTDAQLTQAVTHSEALSFARLIQHGAVALPEPEQEVAISLAHAIEQETVVRNLLERIGDVQPEDFND